MSAKILIDMDGVIADFVGAAHEVHDRGGTFTDPANRGIFEIETIWGISQKEFWKPIDKTEGFWENLQKTPEADHIVELAESLVGAKNVAILTAPHSSPACIPGKYTWLNKHYPQFRKRIIFGTAKEFLAGPERLLFDDRDKNIEAFNAAGGHGILVPRLWNAGHSVHRDCLEFVKEYAELALEEINVLR